MKSFYICPKILSILPHIKVPNSCWISGKQYRPRSDAHLTWVYTVCSGLCWNTIVNVIYFLYVGANACSHTKWSTKLDFPVPEWPVATFPNLKYPLEEYEAENKAEETRCLAEVNKNLQCEWCKMQEKGTYAISGSQCPNQPTHYSSLITTFFCLLTELIDTEDCINKLCCSNMI